MEPQKDNNKIEISEKTLDHISFFEKDGYFAFVYKRQKSWRRPCIW